MRKNFGIIGLGEVANKYHFEAIKAVGGTVMAVCDINQATWQPVVDNHKPDKLCSFTSDYHNLIQDPYIDYVSICTPNYLHIPIALAALDAGKKVICEKPLSTNTLDAQALINHPRANDVAICFQRRFSDQAIAIKNYGKKIAKIQANVFVRRDPEYWNEWRRDKTKSGGANLINIDVHYWDLIQWWIGHNYTIEFAKLAERTGIDQVFFAHLDFQGVDVEFLGSSIHDKRQIDIEVFFEDGQTLVYNNDTGSHNQVYQALLSGSGYVTPSEAAHSLQIVEDIYNYDREH